MLRYTLVVFAAVLGAAVGQNKPTWFLYDQDKEVDFSVRKDVCEEVYPTEAENASNGPIFIPADSDHAKICILFPPLPEKNLAGGWRHDIGSKGACANGCCEFKPPLKNSKAVEHPVWFEGPNCSDVPAELNNAPLFFQGSDGDAKTVCVQSEDGSYVLQEGKIGNCGGRCCIFYANQ